MAPVSRGYLVLSPAGSFGPAVAELFNVFDGLSRDDRLRFDPQVFAGLRFATLYLVGGALNVALGYAGEFKDHPLVAGIGSADEVARNHVTAAAVSSFPKATANPYDHIGVLTGSNG